MVGIKSRIKRLEASAPPASRDRRILELIASASLVSRGQMRGDVAQMSEDELLSAIGTDKESFWQAFNTWGRNWRRERGY